MALKSAIAAVHLAGELGKPAVIQTDSQYVTEGFDEHLDNWKNNGWKTSKNKPVKNQELWEELDTAINQSPVNIHLETVSPSESIPEKEQAHQLAVRNAEVTGYPKSNSAVLKSAPAIMIKETLTQAEV